MKIGVLTYHCVPNFGAQLQALSTVGFLRRKGYEPVILNWYPQDLEEMYSRRVPSEQVSVHNIFTNTILPITEVCRTEKELVEIIERYGFMGIIVGSDALFKYVPLSRRCFFSIRRMRYIKRDVISVGKLEGNPFWGGFVGQLLKRIPVAAFSVSSQNCPYFEMDKQEKQKMQTSLKNYSMITVRDTWTKQMVENVLGIDSIEITPDPVFSFNENCFIQLPTKEQIIDKFHLREKYVLLSFSTKYVQDIYINEISKEVERHGLQPVAFPMPEKLFSTGVKTQINLPLNPLDWYALIKYSSGYIGERMHPIVVCLHNAVPFFSFDEYGTIQASLWGLKKEFVINSSKTYQIVNKAGLLDWYFSYKQQDDLPDAKDVVNRIIHFNSSQCSTFAKSYQEFYENAMTKIVQLFN